MLWCCIIWNDYIRSQQSANMNDNIVITFSSLISPMFNEKFMEKKCPFRWLASSVSLRSTFDRYLHRNLSSNQMRANGEWARERRYNIDKNVEHQYSSHNARTSANTLQHNDNDVIRTCASGAYCRVGQILLICWWCALNVLCRTHIKYPPIAGIRHRIVLLMLCYAICGVPIELTV